MASSTAAYLDTLVLLRKNAIGEWSIPDFERAVNAAQIDYLRENTPPRSDMASMNMLSPFLKQRVVTLVNGIGEYNPGGYATGDFCDGPICWVSGHISQPCNAPPTTDRRFKTVKVLGVEEFISITEDLIDGPSATRPYAMLMDDTRIQVLPVSNQYLHLWYWRNPRPIVVGRDPAYQFPNEQPLEGGTGQVDFEWHQQDVNKIIYKALTMSGIALQADRLIQSGQLLARGNER